MLWLHCCSSHLWHCVSEGSYFLLSGAAFTAIKSTRCQPLKTLTEKKRGPSRCVEGFAEKKLRKKANPRAAWWTLFRCDHSTSGMWGLWPPRATILSASPTKNPLLRYSSVLLSLPLTSRLNVLAYCTSANSWRTLFSRRLWPCLYFDIRCKRNPLPSLQIPFVYLHC